MSHNETQTEIAEEEMTEEEWDSIVQKLVEEANKSISRERALELYIEISVLTPEELLLFIG